MAYDHEYERNGVSNLFMLFAPLEGWRRVEVTDRRTKVDWAHQVKQLVDEDYPDKDRIVLVMDNPVSSTGQALNTHHPASLYEAFKPAEARRIAQRLEIHHTPKPLATQLDRVDGSWLNMAEIELGGAGTPMPGPADSRPGNPEGRDRSLAKTAKPGRNKGGLAVHHRRRPGQTEVPLPINASVLNY